MNGIMMLVYCYFFLAMILTYIVNLEIAFFSSHDSQSEIGFL